MLMVKQTMRRNGVSITPLVWEYQKGKIPVWNVNRKFLQFDKYPKELCELLKHPKLSSLSELLGHLMSNKVTGAFFQKSKPHNVIMGFKIYEPYEPSKEDDTYLISLPTNEKMFPEYVKNNPLWQHKIITHSWLEKGVRTSQSHFEIPSYMRRAILVLAKKLLPFLPREEMSCTKLM